MNVQIPDDLSLDYSLACKLVEYYELKWLTEPETPDERIKWMSAKREMDRDERIARAEAENAELTAQVARLTAPVSDEEHELNCDYTIEGYQNDLRRRIDTLIARRAGLKGASK